MTREEAKTELIRVKRAICMYDLPSDAFEAIDMAIESLSANYTTEKPNDVVEQKNDIVAEPTDLISRADVLDIIKFKRKLANIDGRILLDETEDRINALQSADIPTKLIAKINIDADEVVRKIKDEYDIADSPTELHCPNCGAKMGGDTR